MKEFLFSFFCIGITIHAQAQGCSDAGVCSVGSMNSAGKHEEKTAFTFNSQFGLGDQNVSIFNQQFEAAFKLNEKSNLQCKIPWVIAHGDLGKVSALGDITIAYGRTYFSNSNWALRLNAGFRIAVNRADKSYTEELPANNTLKLSLPMTYQSSLGTNDLLLGTDARYKGKWLFAFGIQYPLIQNNRNTFDTSFVLPGSPAKAYFSSYKLFRRPDLVVRIDRSFILNKSFQLSAAVLPIYHLGHDRAEYFSGGSYAISGSKGLTFNISTAVSCKLSDHARIVLRYSQPLLVRKVRPDGLTRHFVWGLEFRYSL